MHLLNVQILWMTFMGIFMIIIPNRIVFDDMIVDIMTNKKFQAIIKESFIRCRKLKIKNLKTKN